MSGKTKYAVVCAAEDDDDGHSPRNHGLTARKRKLTLLLGFAVAITVFTANLVLLIWTVKQDQPSEDGITTVYTGSCSFERDVSTWSHLAINVLSSLLLAASNSCMQGLAAPTRAEIDRAHAKHQWLDVGVNSARNFGSIDAASALALGALGLQLSSNPSAVRPSSMFSCILLTVAGTTRSCSTRRAKITTPWLQQAQSSLKAAFGTHHTTIPSATRLIR